MLKEYNGYIAGRESSAYVPQGKLLAKSETRTITLTVKIDAKNFDVFLGKVKEIGSYTSEQIHLEDVTFAYTDLNARLNNQKKVEERLLGYLNSQNADYRLVIEIERELSQIREKIEQLSAQLKVMENQIAYSTLTIYLSVRPEWIPPEERTFTQQLGDAVKDSIISLVDALKAFFIVGLAAIPWIIVLAAGIYILVRIVRRLRKR